MNHAEFKAARLSLGLTPIQLANLLGVAREYIYRLEATPDKKGKRKASYCMVKLIRAYLEGYRPSDWPT